jgi:gluconolactonase
MPDDLSNILESSEPELLDGTQSHTEGPLWHRDGYLTFVSIDRSQLVRWDPEKKVSNVIRENTGGGNGCTLDRQGNLIMCEGADRRCLTRMDFSGNVTTIADRWQGKRFHKPNDVICRSDGSIYFTDPSLRLEPALREMDIAGVYRIDPQGGLHLATDQCVYPNGLALSPDETTLYVAISRAEEADFEREARGEFCPNRRLLAFDVMPDGSLGDSRLFIDMASAEPGVPDGMKIDTAGRVFATGSGGIWVISPQGRRLGIIRVPGGARNLAFGGPDFRTLFITGGDSLFSLRVRTPGIGAF